jgi:hypothetical protein
MRRHHISLIVVFVFTAMIVIAWTPPAKSVVPTPTPSTDCLEFCKGQSICQCAKKLGGSLRLTLCKILSAECVSEDSNGPKCQCDVKPLCTFLENGIVMQSFQPKEPTCGTTVFVTSQQYPGDLDGLAGADQKCIDLAQAAGLQGSYIAWLSDSSVDARDRLNTNGPYVRLDGTIIANDKADLLDGTLDAPINIDENGTLQPQNEVWTGTFANGTRAPENCLSWTSSLIGNNGQIGFNDITNSRWTQDSLIMFDTCTTSLPLYCFSQ